MTFVHGVLTGIAVTVLIFGPMIYDLHVIEVEGLRGDMVRMEAQIAGMSGAFDLAVHLEKDQYESGRSTGGKR